MTSQHCSYDWHAALSVTPPLLEPLDDPLLEPLLEPLPDPLDDPLLDPLDELLPPLHWVEHFDVMQLLTLCEALVQLLSWSFDTHCCSADASADCVPPGQMQLM